MAFFDRVENFFESLSDRFRRENSERRREDRELELENEATEAENDISRPSVPVRVSSVDFQAKANAAIHHCEKYELVERQKDASVIRRGAAFTLIITFNQEVELKKQHLLKLYFSFGATPNVHNGTQGVLTVSGKTMFDKSHEEWDARVAGQEGSKVTIEVQIPTDAAVGVWRTAVEVSPREDRSGRHLQRMEHLTYILFNPWNKNDATYLPEEDKREEYVLNDIGKVWVGNYPTARGRHWVYGQFDDVVLPACVLLLEKSGIRPEVRGDPIQVSRAISRVVNSNDENGVVYGRWDGKYEDGSAPGTWTGSISILEQYVRTGTGVKYGQCWVFAGVLNTVCRALGLPSRVVTNLNSAHDTNISLTIDEYIDENGEDYEYDYVGPTPDGIGDSIWNFHVWNDVWMTRPDLPQGYGGWQAVDSTPQETSDGAFQCGPASHEAVRRGQMHLKYDVPFVLAEVNADVVKWQVDANAQDGFKKLSSNKVHVGRQLLTKKIGEVEDDGYFGGDREEITKEYKPDEGTRAERITLYTAARRTRAARHAFRFPSVANDDVDFSIVDIERVPIGDDFSITVKAKNTSDAIRTVTVVLTASSIYYTGAKAYSITRAEGEFVLQPNEEKELSLPVPYSAYYSKLVEHAMVKLVALCNVKETSFAWIGDDKFQVIKPSIKIELLSEAVIGKPLTAKLSFTNPLPTVLRKCSLVVDGPGLLRPKTIPIPNVGPKAEMSYELKIHPKKAKTCTIVATFNSTELLDLTGSKKVVIAAVEG